MAFISSDSLYIMNNDGTGLHCVIANKEYWTYGIDEPSTIRWTEKGIFWIANDLIIRYIVASNTIDTVIHVGDIGIICNQKMGNGDDGSLGAVRGSDVYISTDATRMWCRFQLGPKDYTDINLTTNQQSELLQSGGDATDVSCESHSKRGAHAFIHFSADFSTYDVAWDSQWGHGQCFTKNGSLMLVKFGAPQPMPRHIPIKRSHMARLITTGFALFRVMRRIRLNPITQASNRSLSRESSLC